MSFKHATCNSTFSFQHFHSHSHHHHHHQTPKRPTLPWSKQASPHCHSHQHLPPTPPSNKIPSSKTQAGETWGGHGPASHLSSSRKEFKSRDKRPGKQLLDLPRRLHHAGVCALCMRWKMQSQPSVHRSYSKGFFRYHTNQPTHLSTYWGVGTRCCLLGNLPGMLLVRDGMGWDEEGMQPAWRMRSCDCFRVSWKLRWGWVGFSGGSFL